MKKLFAIKEAVTGRVLEDKDFEKKSVAKEERKKLNKVENGKPEVFKYMITLGVDHINYVSEAERKVNRVKHNYKRKNEGLEEEETMKEASAM